MISHKVKVIKKIFVSPETGFGVFKVTVDGTRESKIIVGNLFDVKEGDFLDIEGEYTTHQKFGEQIKVSRLTFIQPQDTEGIIKFLSMRIKGIGIKTATKIVDTLGMETLEILERNPECLSEIQGIKKTVISEIKKTIRENRIMRDLTVRLSPYGIGSETIYKIYREFGDQAMEITQRNPYELIDIVKGIGFKIADTIARSFGIPKHDPNRTSAGLDFIITQSEQNDGDLYIPEHDLAEKTSLLLDLDTDEINQAICRKIERNELVREHISEPVITSYKNNFIENSIARFLFELSNSLPTGDGFEFDFKKIYEKLSVRLTEEQENAVVSTIKNKLTIITGGPGTGKTTIIRAIIEAFGSKGMEVLIAAPTGRAAKRIEETSHYQASTVHRMLKLNPETKEFFHNRKNPLMADAIIIDEFSMVDSYLFYALLRAIKKKTKLIIIGDKDQLPSVGPGNVLRDIIDSGYFNTIFLNRNFRQTEDSLIIENAYRINQGEFLELRPYTDSLDFIFIRVKSEHQALQKVLGIIDFHKHEYTPNSTNFQILAPMYRGISGIDNINKIIQDRFNPEPFFFQKDRLSFKKLDKVMQLRNNYEKEIFNGEMGLIADFNSENQKIMVDYDGYFVEYEKDEIDELSLAYAVSIHKSQGSEYDTVILVLLPSHSIMLNREIFYTAVSRAKNRIFLLSDEQTISRAIGNSSPRKRKTLLPFKLKSRFESGETD